MKQNTLNNSVINGEVPVPRLMSMPININPHLVENNNIWMNDATTVNRSRMIDQWMDVYQLLAIDSPIYIMSDDPNVDTPSQDLVFTANSGIALNDQGTTKFIVSRFKSTPRTSEEKIIRNYVKNIFGSVNVITPPRCYNGKDLFFEGEADMKAIHFNIEEKRADVYMVGVGIRTNSTFCEWAEDTFDIKIIQYRTPKDLQEYLFHLDCLAFKVDQYSMIVNTQGIDKDVLTDIKKYTDLFEVKEAETEMLFGGLTNLIRVKNAIIMPYSPEYYDKTLSPEDNKENMEYEYKKLDFMKNICKDTGLQLITVDVSHMFSMGAQLSCLTCALTDQYQLYCNNGF
jgi:N-dimethylarginine dimethylaminohydrolase